MENGEINQKNQIQTPFSFLIPLINRLSYYLKIKGFRFIKWAGILEK